MLVSYLCSEHLELPFGEQERVPFIPHEEFPFVLSSSFPVRKVRLLRRLCPVSFYSFLVICTLVHRPHGQSSIWYKLVVWFDSLNLPGRKIFQTGIFVPGTFSGKLLSHDTSKHKPFNGGKHLKNF